MSDSYPRRDQARGIWKINDITKNIKDDGTYPSGATTGLFAGGGTPGASNTIDQITIENAGNATDFGDLATSETQGGGGFSSSFVRGIFGIGVTPSSTNALEYVHFKSQGNAADFGDKTNSVSGFAGTSNNVRAIWGGGYSRTNVMDFVTIATLGNATDFGDLTVARGGIGATNSPTRAFFHGGNNPSDNSVNTIDQHDFSSTGNAVDFGDLSQAVQNPGSACSSTRGITAGGLIQSSGSGPATDIIQYYELGSKGDGVDFGDLAAAKNSNYGTSSQVRGVFAGGQTPTVINVIEFVTIATRANATDFGDLTTATRDKTPSSNNHGGLQEFHPRAPELYSPTGKPLNSGKEKGDIGVIAGGHNTPGSTRFSSIEYVQMASTGNAQSFGDLSAAVRASGGVGGNTRAIFFGIRTPTYTDTIEYNEFPTKGNSADFGNLAAAIEGVGSCNNETRGICYGGGTPSSPNYTNVIQYVTIASTGNATDFGDTVQASGVANLGGSGSSTRGVFGGGYAPPSNNEVNTIGYITIAATGNATDFGDLTVTRAQNNSYSSDTRAIFVGGVSPGTTNVLDYITIGSTGNATDFGDLSVARRDPGALSNNLRGIALGGYSASPLNDVQNVIDYVTIASTGNASDFGDLISKRENMASASNGHGGLS